MTMRDNSDALEGGALLVKKKKKLNKPSNMESLTCMYMCL